MRQPLKERIQNAINQAVYHEEVAYGALIVGGRRITRKKRKHKPGKKDQNNNSKKNHKKEQKNKKYQKLVEEEEEDKSTLIAAEDGVKPDGGDDGGAGGDTESAPVTAGADGNTDEAATVESETLTVQIGGEEKKSEDGDPKVGEEVALIVKPGSDNPKAEIREERGVSSVKDAIKDIEGNKNSTSNGTVKGKEDKSKKADAKAAEVEADGKEKSPLIEKESKVKDTGPGALCCSIL